MGTFYNYTAALTESSPQTGTKRKVGRRGASGGDERIGDLTSFVDVLFPTHNTAPHDQAPRTRSRTSMRDALHLQHELQDCFLISDDVTPQQKIYYNIEKTIKADQLLHEETLVLMQEYRQFPPDFVAVLRNAAACVG